MLHTLRHAIHDIELWREILRGLNKHFWHSVVTTTQIEAYISEKAGYDFGPFFDQYLRTKEIPVLMYLPTDDGVAVWFAKVVKGFHMPIVLNINGEEKRLEVGQKSVQIPLDKPFESLAVDRNFYLTSERYAPEEQVKVDSGSGEPQRVR